jgi:conjugal transfer mating pair stabilization protein TraG
MFDLADGTVDPKAFATSLDVWALMGKSQSGAVLDHHHCGNVDVATRPASTPSSVGCPPKSRMREHWRSAERRPRSRKRVAAISGEIETATSSNKLANAGARRADILRQNALINAIGDTSQIIGQKINDPAALLLGAARAQSSAATNMWYIASGRTASRFCRSAQCPGALIYALFPLSCCWSC